MGAVRAPAFGILGLLFTAAAFVVFAGDSLTLKAIALAIFGIACVVAVSLVFLAIGRAEDAEREAVAAEAPAAAGPARGRGRAPRAPPPAAPA